MARLDRHPLRRGWTHAGLRWGVALLLVLWTTGFLLELWPAAAAFELDPLKAGLRHASATVHGTASWFAWLAAGRWTWPHVAQVWRARSGGRWWLGIAAIALTCSIAATGLGLLYGPADWHDAVAQAHWWIAVGWPMLVLLHALPRRRTPP